MKRIRSFGIVAVATTFLLQAPPAVAGPFDVFGFGSRAISMGGAVTAIADDYTAIFYNPANLVLRKKVHLGAEFLTSIPDLSIALADSGSRQPVEADGFSGLGLGVLFPLGGLVDYRFAFGIVLYLPTDQLLRVDGLDPIIPRWFLWDSLADKLQILLGVGGEIFDWLSVGVGFQSLASMNGAADIGVDLINEELNYRDMKVEIANTVAPIVGLHIGPLYGLSFGFSWRSHLQVDFFLPINFDFGDTLDINLITEGRSLYTPHTLSFGLAWDIFETGWLVAFDARYNLWSNAPDPALFFGLDITGDIVVALDAEEVFDLVPGPSGLTGFADTWSFHSGVEYQPSDLITGRLGYQFRDSPLPDQTGLSNYVDNDSHTLSAGFGLTFPDPLNLDDEPATIEITAAYTVLPDEETVKDSDADPIGDYIAGGEILTLNFTLRHDF